MVWDAITISLPFDIDQEIIKDDIEFLKSTGLLKCKNLIVINDPCKDVGSGGSALNALLFTTERLCAQNGFSILEGSVLEKSNILIVLVGSLDAFASIQDPNNYLFETEKCYMFRTSFMKSIINASKVAKKSNKSGLWIIGTDSNWDLVDSDMTDIPLRHDAITAFSFEGPSFLTKSHGVYKVDSSYKIIDLSYCSEIENKDDNLIVLAFFYFPPSLSCQFLSMHKFYPISATTYYGIDSGAIGLKLSIVFDFLLRTCENHENFIKNRLGGQKIQINNPELLVTSRVLIVEHFKSDKSFIYPLRIQNYSFQQFGGTKRCFAYLHDQMLNEIRNIFMKVPNASIRYGKLDRLLKSAIALQTIRKIEKSYKSDYFSTLMSLIPYLTDNNSAAQLLYTISLGLQIESKGLGGLRSGPAENPCFSTFLSGLRSESFDNRKEILKEMFEEVNQNWRNEPIRMTRAARHIEAAAQMFISSCVEDICNEKLLKIVKRESNVPISCSIFAPSRVDFYGGWLDTPPIFFDFNDAAVCNAAIRLDDNFSSSVVLTRINNINSIQIEIDDAVFEINTDEKLISSARNPAMPGSIICACIVSLGFSKVSNFLQVCNSEGLNFRLVSKLPHGSGLGTSSIFASAVLKAIGEIAEFQRNMKYSIEEQLVTTVLKVEQILTTGGGWQDQIGAIYPGIKFGIAKKIDSSFSIICKPVHVSQKFENEINNRLVLVYTGRTRLAKNLLQEVIRNWYKRNETKEVLQKLHEGLTEFRERIENEEIPIDLINRYYDAKKILTNGCEPAIVKSFLDDLKRSRLISTGWLAGAGGGGFLYLWLNSTSSKLQIDQFIKNNQKYSEMRAHSITLLTDKTFEVRNSYV